LQLHATRQEASQQPTNMLGDLKGFLGNVKLKHIINYNYRSFV